MLIRGGDPRSPPILRGFHPPRPPWPVLGRYRCRRHWRRGTAAEHIQPVQGRGARDHLREADLLAGRRQPGDAGQQRDPGRARQACRRRAEHGAERVGAGVAQHRPLAQILGEQAQPRSQRRRRAGRARGGEQRGQGDGHLDGPAWPQVEQVDQVRAAGYQRGVEDDVGGRAAGRGRARQAGEADATELDRPGGHLAVAQRAKVTAESAAVTRSGEVVVGTERGGARSADRDRRVRPPARRSSQPSGHPLRQQLGQRRAQHRRDRPGRDRWSLQQRERLAPVVGAGPGLGTARRAAVQGGVGQPGRACRCRAGYRVPRQPAREPRLAHGFAFLLGGGVAVMLADGLGVGTGDGATALAPLAVNP